MPNREIEDGNEIDRDDSLIDAEDVPYEKLMQMLTGGDDSETGDDVAFGTGEEKDVKEPAVVSVEEGVDLLDEASQAKRKEANPDAPPVEEGKDEPASDMKAEGQAPDAPTPPADDLDSMLAGIADDKRDAVKARIAGADEVMAIFKGRDDELKAHGVSAAQAMQRLIDINAYANRNPSDYIAWAAGQFGGNPQEVMAKAAERLGFKLVAAEPEGSEGDAFEDPEVKAMRAELAQYKAREAAPDLGPDAPAQRAQVELSAFAAQSPHWNAVGPQVAALARAHVETNRRPATIEDVKRFYTASVIAAGLQPVPAEQANPTLAAQVQQPVAQVSQKTAAPSESVQRAKVASKSLDGSGQGAGRRPAMDPDASLESVVGNIYRQFTEKG